MPGVATGVRWSPDGSTLLITTQEYGGDELTGSIYRLPASGGTPVLLTTGETFPSQPRWSPDGLMIAFTAELDGENNEIFVMNADGSNERRLTDHPRDDVVPQWSHDGAEIRFSTRRNGTWDIAAVPVAGGDVRMIAETPLNVGSWWLSPDGSTVVFVGTPDGNQIVSVSVESLLASETN